MAAETMYVTPAGAGDKGGSTWANAMGLAEWQTDVTDNAEAGDIYYVAGGTYTLTGNWSTVKVGAVGNHISIIGVKSTTTAEPPTEADYAYGIDRPLIAAAANTFDFLGNYCKFLNLRVTTTAAWGFRSSQYNTIHNCYVYNSSSVAGRSALYTSSIAFVSACEAICTNGYAITTSIFSSIRNCYAHDSGTGLHPTTHYIVIENNLVVDCSVSGLTLGNWGANVVVNNTIYNCGTGIIGATAYSGTFTNNIISNCTVGANWTAANNSNFWDYNCWNNTTDVINVTTGYNSLLATDPQFVDAANGDFRIKQASPCLNAGLPSLGGSLAGYNGKTSIGAWQPNAKISLRTRNRYDSDDIYGG